MSRFVTKSKTPLPPSCGRNLWMAPYILNRTVTNHRKPRTHPQILENHVLTLKDDLFDISRSNEVLSSTHSLSTHEVTIFQTHTPVTVLWDNLPWTEDLVSYPTCYCSPLCGGFRVRGVILVRRGTDIWTNIDTERETLKTRTKTQTHWRTDLHSVWQTTYWQTRK